MSELMKRLYAMADSVSQSQYERDLAADSADEIERLQAQLDAVRRLLIFDVQWSADIGDQVVLVSKIKAALKEAGDE